MKRIVYSYLVVAVLTITAALTSCGSGGLSGKWETSMEGITILLEFSGKSYAMKTIFPSGIPEEVLNRVKEMNYPISGNEVTFEKGTYSISDDKIEFVLDDKFISSNYGEKVKVMSFSRTENTITMDGERFTKK